MSNKLRHCMKEYEKIPDTENCDEALNNLCAIVQRVLA